MILIFPLSPRSFNLTHFLGKWMKSPSKLEAPPKVVEFLRKTTFQTNLHFADLPVSACLKHYIDQIIILPWKLTCPLKIVVGRPCSLWNSLFLVDIRSFSRVLTLHVPKKILSSWANHPIIFDLPFLQLVGGRIRHRTLWWWWLLLTTLLGVHDERRAVIWIWKGSGNSWKKKEKMWSHRFCWLKMVVVFQWTFWHGMKIPPLGWGRCVPTCSKTCSNHQI